MKSILKIILTLALFFSLLSASAQSVVGTWSGELLVGAQKLIIVFHIAETDGQYRSTMDSPDQGAAAIPVSFTEYTNPYLKLKLPNIAAEYVGKISGDTLINGTFSQAGASFPMTLRKGAMVRKRPQEPQPPFNYNVVNVKFENKKAKITLAGTMTYPSKGDKFPAVILVSGSGAQNRDEELMGHKPFLLLADYLTKRGIAVLRYDDRGFGESTGDFKSATTADFMEDALSAVEYLRTQPNIDKSKIGIIGHSEGGSVAFMAAAQDHSLDFIVSMAGMAVKGRDLLLKQNEEIFALGGASEEYVKLYSGVLSKVYRIVEENSDLEIAANQSVIADTLFSKEEMKLPESMRKNTLLLFSQFANPWWRYFLNVNPSDAIRKMGSTRILALNGAKDCQVDAELNFEAIKQNSKTQTTYRKYNNLNHLFQNCATGDIGEYAQIEETISEQVLKDIADWILNGSL